MGVIYYGHYIGDKMTIQQIVQSMNLAYDNAQRAKERGDNYNFWFHKEVWERLNKELDKAIKAHD